MSRFNNAGVKYTSGEHHFEVSHYVWTDQNRGSWDNQLILVSRAAWGDGLAYSMQGFVDCSAGSRCTSVSGTEILPKPMIVGQTTVGQAVFRSTVYIQEQAEVANTWQMSFPLNLPGHFGPPLRATFTAPKVRCDWGVFPPVNQRANIGCVFPAFTATHVVPPIGPTADAGKHIRRAQLSGLPGATDGQPLHRLADKTFIGLNRDKACPQAWATPVANPPVSCDEYPYASTVEGAYTGSGGTASGRSWDGCLIPSLGPAFGPTGYSVCYINAAHNSADGTALSTFYGANRIIPGDPFFVWAPPLAPL